MMLSAMQSALGLASGALVGFSLGLVGGGGSILAVPLMVYVVGVPEPHVAIGTSAFAVAANAAVNLSNHARGGTVVWSCALMFAAAGIAGAFGGSILGKMLDGQRLLALFALVMLVIAMLMLKTRARLGLPDVKMSLTNLPAIIGLGLVTGTMSGFFGIGGGFLIVPALMLAPGMSIMNAVSSSLVAVTAFGLAAARSRSAFADDEKVLTEALVLRDPDVPVTGNLQGDITIVEWSDYQCPYCRKLEPELRQVVHDDGKVRLVLKDWPILGPISVVAARMALACKFQDKYDQAHDALIGVNSKLTEPRINELLAG